MTPKTLTLRETYDFAATITLPARLRVSQCITSHRSVSKTIAAGTSVTVTYHRGGFNCTVYVLRPDHTVISAQVVATPGAVLAATGIDVTKA